MYIPSEVPWTLEQGERFLRDANSPHGCPVRLTLDVGHQAGMHYGLSGPDLDYLEWIRRFAAGTLDRRAARSRGPHRRGADTGRSRSPDDLRCR